ncbi:MAG: TetR/AcrR family transcriptional regulator [Chitinophagaceae bacterium]|nr:TetR/AcrR family transcriptional regulator [Chitinophagaceae bacterium]MCW5929104.1 TetR/AcrR family transcriptional regulator [Chitinophagaceae bacterium]
MPPIKAKRNGTKKEIIISKAAKLFRDKGFAATSMRDLAENVGVEAASLYNHIQSKAEILQEICFKVANLLTTHLEKVKADNQLNAIGKIQAILKMHIDQMLKNRDEAHVADREWRHLTEPYLSNFKAQRKAYRQWLAHIIEDGIQNKEIKPIDASTAVIIMLHAISCIESWHRSEQKIPEDQLEKNMIIILVEGLKYND